MPVGGAGDTFSQHLNFSCGTVGSFSHFHTLLHISLFVGSSQIDRVGRWAGGGGGVKNKLLSHIKNVQNANRLKIHTHESVCMFI